MSMTFNSLCAMKKTLISFFAIAASIAALVSCAKETPTIDEEQLLEVTIIAGNPEAQPDTKTEMVGSTPKWSVGDKLGVSSGNSTQYEFTTDIVSASTTASFTGTTVSGDLYAYYPYTSNGLTADGKAKVDIPANQSPTVNSFDGKADILVAKKFTVDPGNTVVENLEFARLCAIVKIVLTDTDSEMTGVQHPTTVSMTAESDLVGRVYVDLPNQEIDETSGLYYNGQATVTANYTAETKYAINGSNATYLIVYPQTLSEGTTLTVAASTEDYHIEKDITVPVGGIEFLPGKVTTLNISVRSSHITHDSGAALPFNDDMSWADNGANDDGTDLASTISTASSGLYVSASKAYKGQGGLKLGTGSYAGSITTKELDLSGAFYIAIEAGQYGSDTGSIVVSIDGDTPVISENDFSDVLYANIAAGTYTNKSKVTIATSAKRGRIYSVEIISGTYVPAPKAITFTQPTGAAATAGCSFTVSVGGSPISSGDTVASGTTVTLTANAGTDYEFTSWAVTGATVADANASTTTFEMGTAPVSISASFSSTSGGVKRYTLTISSSDFNSTSYAANNGSHSFTATSTDSSEMAVDVTSNQIMQQSSSMQWQKNNAYLYNTTDLGSIVSVTVNSTDGSFTTYYGTSENPSSNTSVGSGNGFFKVVVGGATGKTDSVVIVFDN